MTRSRPHPNADMMVISASFPLSEFDAGLGLHARPALAPAGLRLDRHQPRRQAVDRQGPRRRGGPQGRPNSSNIDANLDVKWGSSEIDQNEYERFSYISAASDSQRIHIGHPAARMTDGLFIGLHIPSRPRMSRGRTSRSGSTSTRTPTGAG